MDNSTPVTEQDQDTQRELASQFVMDLLRTLTIPADIAAEAVLHTEPLPRLHPRNAGPTSVRAFVNGPEDYTLSAEAQSHEGMFLMQGMNNTGKTSMLLVASILLGMDWSTEDENGSPTEIALFLEGEDRYLETAKRFQTELELGKRNAQFELTTAAMSLSITVESARVSVDFQGQTRDFDLNLDEWEPYRRFIRPLVQPVFIPQRRDYLKQICREVASEIMLRIAAVERYLDEQRGAIMVYSGSDLQMLERDVLIKRGEVETSKVNLEEIEENVELVQRIRSAEKQNVEAFERMVKIGFLRRESQALRIDSERLSRTKEEIDTTRDALAALRKHFEKAGPALKRLVQSMRDAEGKIGSGPLRDYLKRTLPLKSIDKWLDFYVNYEFAPHSVYMSLGDRLSETPDCPTFPFIDEITGVRVESIEQLEGLFEEYTKWSRSFAQHLKPHLDKFSRSVEGCEDIGAENLDVLESQLYSDEQFLEDTESKFYSDLEGFQTRLSRFANLVGVDDIEDLDALVVHSEEVIAQLEREVGLWRHQGEAVASLVGRLDIDADEFWAAGGAEPQLKVLQQHLADLQTIVTDLKDELAPLDTEFERRRHEEQTSREHRFARALSIVEYTNIEEIRNYLSSGLDPQAADLSDLQDWNPHDMLASGVDLLTPLREGMIRLVTDRCGSYYSPEKDGTWVPWKVSGLNLEEATLVAQRDGEERIVRIHEELGTGVRAAMTVRSLASRTHSPAYLSVVLVDEWGDVEQQSLAQTVYQDIQALPNPVVAIFSLPGPSATAVLRDAQSSER